MYCTAVNCTRMSGPYVWKCYENSVQVNINYTSRVARIAVGGARCRRGKSRSGSHLNGCGRWSRRRRSALGRNHVERLSCVSVNHVHHAGYNRQIELSLNDEGIMKAAFCARRKSKAYTSRLVPGIWFRFAPSPSRRGCGVGPSDRALPRYLQSMKQQRREVMLRSDPIRSEYS